MEPHPCLSESEIALFVDMALNEAEKRRVLSHLSRCGRCRRLCMDDARFVAAWRSLGGELPPVPDAASNSPRHGRSGFGWLFRAFKPAFAGLAAVVVIATIWFALHSGPEIPGRVTDPVLAAVETASRNGPFVLPGGEHGLAPALSRYRSGNGDGNERLQSSLDFLQDRVNNGDAGEEVFYWLIAGYLSQGRAALARVLASDAVDEFPESSRIGVLCGVAKFADGDLPGAEIELKRLAVVEPQNPVVLINLGLVLMDGGNTTQATEILERIIDNNPGTPVAGRAQAILETAPAR